MAKADYGHHLMHLAFFVCIQRSHGRRLNKLFDGLVDEMNRPFVGTVDQTIAK
jgi:hypothetical protein